MLELGQPGPAATVEAKAARDRADERMSVGVLILTVGAVLLFALRSSCSGCDRPDGADATTGDSTETTDTDGDDDTTTTDEGTTETTDTDGDDDTTTTDESTTETTDTDGDDDTNTTDEGTTETTNTDGDDGPIAPPDCDTDDRLPDGTCAAFDDDYSDVVALRGQNGWLCSGTVVGPGIVLTARHCLDGAVQVVFGENALTSRCLRPVTERAPVGGLPPNVDVGLVHFETIADWGRERRECKPFGPLVRADYAGERPRPLAGPNASGAVRIFGYGTAAYSRQRHYGLRRFRTLQLDPRGCDSDRQRQTGCQPRIETVMVATRTTDTCHGDSGGPALLLTSGERAPIAATTSRAMSSRIDCGNGGVYTLTAQDSLAGNMIRAALARAQETRR